MNTSLRPAAIGIGPCWKMEELAGLIADEIQGIGDRIAVDGDGRPLLEVGHSQTPSGAGFAYSAVIFYWVVDHGS